jgi:CAAX prenyl protease-like protein
MRSESQARDQAPLIGYVLPTALFLVLTTIEGMMPNWYVALYVAKAVLVTGCLYFYRATLRDYRPDWRGAGAGVLVGLLIAAVWIPLDRLTPYHLTLGGRAAYNPFTAISNSSVRAVFLAVRFYGLVVMVPVMEELFWRSFLLRYVSAPDGDFHKLPQGTFTWGAFALVAVCFAAAHPEWLSALVCAVAYGLLLKRTRNLTSTLIAHAITNLLLGLQIVMTHNWKYW